MNRYDWSKTDENICSFIDVLDDVSLNFAGAEWSRNLLLIWILLNLSQMLSEKLETNSNYIILSTFDSSLTSMRCVTTNEEAEKNTEVNTRRQLVIQRASRQMSTHNAVCCMLYHTGPCTTQHTLSSILLVQWNTVMSATSSNVSIYYVLQELYLTRTRLISSHLTCEVFIGSVKSEKSTVQQQCTAVQINNNTWFEKS